MIKEGDYVRWYPLNGRPAQPRRKVVRVLRDSIYLEAGSILSLEFAEERPDGKGWQRIYPDDNDE